jgi:antitoxin component of MazEF toxin-antitoxin module
MIQKVIRLGTHSLAVTIPADFVHSLGVKAGDGVKVETDKENGKMSLCFSGVMQLSFTSRVNKKN